ncbi:outer membrane protein [Novosphingobium hassiacum]|uniref:Outer membrane protein n=1 Tax=Novosphingobium hassiacum TaxID=173676 RepID=A0A7W5ZVF1_9SPHN|nr:TolC family protein [Novosphingobium hassiacum]MBB3860678.1 outer membrane protein [Novosphingobium hassiacum]
MRFARSGLIAGVLTSLLVTQASAMTAPTFPRRADGATRVSGDWQVPRLEVSPDDESEGPSTETLASALDAAYRSAPELQARRYELRATDEDYAQSLADLRPSALVQITGNYTKTVPGRITQANRPLVDQLTSPTITSNRLSAELVVDQPLSTGGRASAEAAAARAAIYAGREDLRVTEGDLLLSVIIAYSDIRRDVRTLGLRKASLKQFEATLQEVTARREAGELTRTDIAQAATQINSAIATTNIAEQQLAQDRSAYAALVGREPGTLAPEPPLPQLPQSLDAAFDMAQRLNPELALAIAAERASRARIAAARALARPTLSLRGIARIGGPASPFDLRNDDQDFIGQAVLTVPLSQGGRVGSLVEQARDRNSADRERIEAARRTMVQGVVNAWNAVMTAQRNLVIQDAQREAAAVLDEGTFEEYRAGLRSTFDVLFAHGSLREAEIALVATRRDLYVAQASLLRQLGLLEVGAILTQTPLYDPEINTRKAARRGSLPWEQVARGLDTLVRPAAVQRDLEQPSLPDAAPEMAAATAMPAIEPATTPNLAPIPGTVGTPKPRQAARRKTTRP